MNFRAPGSGDKLNGALKAPHSHGESTTRHCIGKHANLKAIFNLSSLRNEVYAKIPSSLAVILMLSYPPVTIKKVSRSNLISIADRRVIQRETKERHSEWFPSWGKTHNLHSVLPCTQWSKGSGESVRAVCCFHSFLSPIPPPAADAHLGSLHSLPWFSVTNIYSLKTCFWNSHFRKVSEKAKAIRKRKESCVKSKAVNIKNLLHEYCKAKCCMLAESPRLPVTFFRKGRPTSKPPCRGEMFVFIVHIKMHCSVDQLCGTFTVVIKPALYCFNLSRALLMFVQ